MVTLEDNRGYTATEILMLTKGEARTVIKHFRNGEVLVNIQVLSRGVVIDWKIRTLPQYL